MRLDKYIVEKGYVTSRARAVEHIENGDVSINDEVITKASYEVKDDDVVVFSGETLMWVSRAGLKLEEAFEAWDLDVSGKVCLDIGASTGGFTEVLLTEGAEKVYAVDVGHGQLHEKVKSDPRVVDMEGVNIREVSKADFDEPIEFVCIDVSFISLELVLPKAYELLREGSLVSLIKPQFEVGKDNINKGIVSAELHESVKAKITNLADSLGFKNIQIINSPIKGGSGNKEFLMYATK